MTNHLRRARRALHDWLRGRRGSPLEALGSPSPLEPRRNAAPVSAWHNLVIADERLTFVDSAGAIADPWSWLAAFESAVVHDVPLAEGAITIVKAHGVRLSSDTALPLEQKQRLLGVLRPRAGLARALRELHVAGFLDALFKNPVAPHALLAVQGLERLLTDASLMGERFGSMLRELSAPELLVLALLLHDAGRSADAPDPEEAVRTAQTALDRLAVDGDARRMVEFLLRNRLRMASIAFHQDAGDPAVVGGFASLFKTEEQLKMLCVFTVADSAAMGAQTLTPWKAEILWRLFVDAYNHLTIAYGDEVIDSHEAVLASLGVNRPHDIAEAEMATFLEGLPRRYLTLFQPEVIYEHVRLSRQMSRDDVHFFLTKHSDVWELTVVTDDKPYLFSNICGVLADSGLDILRGHALTSRTGLVLDVFEFTDHKGCLVRPQLDPLLSDVVAGRVEIARRLQEKERTRPAGHTKRVPPVIHFDSESSTRYTILEIVAEDVPGLLHRMSRIISKHGCVVDLVLISTEGQKAVDVFHLRSRGAKLNESEELALTEDLERLLGTQ